MNIRDSRVTFSTEKNLSWWFSFKAIPHPTSPSTLNFKSTYAPNPNWGFGNTPCPIWPSIRGEYMGNILLQTEWQILHIYWCIYMCMVLCTTVQKWHKGSCSEKWGCDPPVWVSEAAPPPHWGWCLHNIIIEYWCLVLHLWQVETSIKLITMSIIVLQ